LGDAITKRHPPLLLVRQYYNYGYKRRQKNIPFVYMIFNCVSVFLAISIGKLSDKIGKDLKGTGFGLYHAILGITLLPASLIAGLLYDNVNSDAPFYFGSLMAMLSVILMIIFVISKPKKQIINKD